MYYPVVSCFDVWLENYKKENVIEEKSLKEMLQAAFSAGEEQGHKSERWMMNNIEEEEPPLPEGGRWMYDDEVSLEDLIAKVKSINLKKDAKSE